MKTYNERHLYVVLVASGWRIERPSGNEIARQLPSFEEAEHLLTEAGYKLVSLYNGEYRFDHNRVG